MQSQIRFILASSLALALLGGCAQLRPTKTDCSARLTAAGDGVRVTIRTVDDSDQAVEARMNGVQALCYDKNGQTVMQVKLGLRVVRDLAENTAPVFLEVPVISAVLDAADKPLATKSESFRMAFPSRAAAIYPVVELEASLPADGRMVISLSPQRL